MNKSVSVLQRLTGDQKLALAVILQAIGDAHNPRVPFKTRRDAADFLRSGRSFIWCQAAGVHPQSLRDAAQGILADSRAIGSASMGTCA